MNRNYFLWIVCISLTCLVLIFLFLSYETESPPAKVPAFQPPLSPYKNFIAGVGIVEPNSGNINLGAPMNRIVEDIYVREGEKVAKDEPLIQLERKDLEAELAIRQASLEQAKAKLQKMEAFPRNEDVQAAAAALTQAEAEYDFARTQNERVLQLPDQRAISEEERNKRRLQLQQAAANLEKAKANLEKIKQGTWKPDLEIAQAALKQAEAYVSSIKAEIERTTIRSPIDGEILQILIHKGEQTSTDPNSNPMIVIGHTNPLHLRVSINQLDISFFNKNDSAVAYVQGSSSDQYPLKFVRVEPVLTHKHTFTNQITDVTDTRVMKIIYQIEKDNPKLFVGEQMDVFIDTKNRRNRGK